MNRKSTYDKLEQRLRRLEALIECSQLATIQLTKDNIITYINPEFTRVFGFKPKEALGKLIDPLITLQDYREEAEELSKRTINGSTIHKITKRRRKDGTLIDVEIFAGPLKVEGEVVGSFGQYKDITEKKKMEDALQRKEEKYRAILEGIEDSYLEVDLKGNFQFFNDSFCKMLGYSKDELIGMNNQDVTDKANAKRVYQIFTNVYNTEKPVTGVGWEIIRKDGTKRYIETSISLIKDIQGQRIGFRGIGRDVTEKKQMESELIQTKNFLQNIFDSSIDGIVTTDLHGNIVFGSPAITNILDYDIEEIAGEKGYSFYGNGIEDAKTIMKELTKKGGLKEHDIKVVKKNGKLININLSVSALKNEKGEMNGTLGIFRDTTDKIHMETQLRQAHKMETIGRLAGGVAHDLNNILSGIVSYPDLLLIDLPHDSPLRDPVLTIKKSGEKAATIVQDLLTLARRGVDISEVVNLNHIISEYLESPEFKKLISFHAQVEVKTNFDKDLLNIMGSPVHLIKTVMNLISNAAESISYGGKIFISTQNRYIDKPIRGYDDVQEGDYVTLTVADTGTGISPKDMEMIFEPFYTKKVMGKSGTGLGMTVVWGTVKDHKGYIDIESSEGKGTTFMLYFPVTREELAKNKFQFFIEEHKGKGESILVVDDVEEQREIATIILKKLGYSVLSVSSGEEAVQYMKNNSADLIVLDMIMDPGIDGLDTYKQILQIHPEQKAIIASGFSDTKRVKKAQKLGAGKYIKKPYTIEQIGIAIKKELEK